MTKEHLDALLAFWKQIGGGFIRLLLYLRHWQKGVFVSIHLDCCLVTPSSLVFLFDVGLCRVTLRRNFL
jgi:hypothetical protein